VELVPVVVKAAPREAAAALRELLDDYGATLVGDETVEIAPDDATRRGTVIYRVIQASRTVAETHTGADMFLITEDGNRWRLPPPQI
jgi:hypothetical protein